MPETAAATTKPFTVAFIKAGETRIRRYASLRGAERAIGRDVHHGGYVYATIYAGGELGERLADAEGLSLGWRMTRVTPAGRVLGLRNWNEAR